MEKISTVAIERIPIFKQSQLRIGLDLGDRTSHYCIVNEAGAVLWEDKLPTTRELYRRRFNCRIALLQLAHFTNPFAARKSHDRQGQRKQRASVSSNRPNQPGNKLPLFVIPKMIRTVRAR